MAGRVNFELVSPERILVSDTFDMVVIPGGDGDIGVLPDHGKYVVVRLDDSNEATFKQLVIEGGRKYLKALNPDWPDRIIEVNVKATICGVIVFKGQML